MQTLVHVAFLIHSVLLTFLTLQYRCSDWQCAECNTFVGLHIEIPLFKYVLSIVLSQIVTMVCIIYYYVRHTNFVVCSFSYQCRTEDISNTFSCSPDILIDRVQYNIFVPNEIPLLKYYSFPIPYNSNMLVWYVCQYKERSVWRQVLSFYVIYLPSFTYYFLFHIDRSGISMAYRYLVWPQQEAINCHMLCCTNSEY